jgi:hypothetical protein
MGHGEYAHVVGQQFAHNPPAVDRESFIILPMCSPSVSHKTNCESNGVVSGS